MKKQQKVLTNATPQERIERIELAYLASFHQQAGVRAQLQAHAIVNQMIDLGESSFQRSGGRDNTSLLAKVDRPTLIGAYRQASTIVAEFKGNKKEEAVLDLCFYGYKVEEDELSTILLNVTFAIQCWGHIRKIDAFCNLP